MKNITAKTPANNESKGTIKINILYIIAIQLLGIFGPLLMEYQSPATSKATIEFAHQNDAEASSDLAIIQICNNGYCKSTGP